MIKILLHIIIAGSSITPVHAHKLILNLFPRFREVGVVFQIQDFSDDDSCLPFNTYSDYSNTNLQCYEGLKPSFVTVVLTPPIEDQGISYSAGQSDLATIAMATVIPGDDALTENLIAHELGHTLGAFHTHGATIMNAHVARYVEGKILPWAARSKRQIINFIKKEKKWLGK